MSVATLDPETAPDTERRYLPPWTEGALSEPPRAGWKLWVGLLGPGIVLAGTSIGSGEWLFGPAVTAQYGATLLWLASLSIIMQVFCNLMMMRYTLYCGEPIMAGGLRTWPGPMSWIAVYAVLDISAIWPFNASNAAVPLAAAILGRLPATASDLALVKGLGYAIFVLAFVPLIFGGTVYRMLEKVMTTKLVLVLGYLTFVAIFMVSRHNVWEVATGFFRFGEVPLRADIVVAGPHFNLREREDDRLFSMRGTHEGGKATVAEFAVGEGKGREVFRIGAAIPEKYQARYRALLMQAESLAKPDRFFAEGACEGATISVAGRFGEGRRWVPEEIRISGTDAAGVYATLAEVPESLRGPTEQLIEHQGSFVESLVPYVMKNRQLPPLDWAMLAAFAAIAGAGGLSNTMFSNYCRDKGWGMGAKVGAIPSAIGGRTISLSHVGEVFPINAANESRWRGWIRHIVRDQGIFMVCSFLGMALPCMLSLEFIRNATAEGNRVAAMTAEGMAQRFPDYAQLFWIMTLLCGFLVLAPGQVSVGDQIARRWTDILWTGTKWAKNLAGSQVRYVYYTILAIYAVWGIVTLTYFDPLQIAKIGTVLGNVALGVTTLQAWYINRILLPRELQPSWFLQIGTLLCGFFFLGISVIVVITL